MLILSICCLIVAADQVTKFLVRAHMQPGDLVPVVPNFFNISHVTNTGAAWGILSGFSNVLIVLSIVVLVLLVGFRRHFLTDTLMHRAATWLMIGGIVGNLIDRVRLGYVVDFVDLYWGRRHFPSFNVADAAICVGVGIYILSQSRREAEVKPDSNGSGGAEPTPAAADGERGP